MTLIYANGAPGYLDFQLAENNEQIPKAAVVYASCDGQQYSDYLDHYTCRTMTDGEYYELQALIRQARKIESERLRSKRAANPFRRLCAWLKDVIARPIVAVGALRSQARRIASKNA